MRTSSSNFEVIQYSDYYNYGYNDDGERVNNIDVRYLRTKDGAHSVLMPTLEDIDKNTPCYIYLNKNENPKIAIYPAIAVMGIPYYNIYCFCNVNVYNDTEDS
jgi:hypothetical protein